MTFGSLFSGIGGLDLGLERAGLRCLWQCEADPFARRVLAKHWPGIPCYDDVRTLDGTRVERPDMLCGGFPCQDISTAHTAGKRRGLAGPRSGLWSDFSRIVRCLRPGWVLVENSPAWRGWVAAVCDDLCGLGYCPTPVELEASSFGAPHARPRVFVIAHAYGDGESPCPVDAAMACLPDASISGRYWRSSEPGPLGLDDGIPAGVALELFGSAVVPQVAEWIGRRLMEVA